MIDVVLFGLLLVLFLLYAGLHMFLFRGLSRFTAPDHALPFQGISVIVAARNEEQTIRSLLESLEHQDYPADCFEVIVVNDRSTDDTAAVVRSFLPHFHALTLIEIRENRTDMPHKKHALQNGISHARFGLLAFTDADCIVPTQWLRELSRNFTEETGMVAGYSPYVRSRGTFYLQYEEFKKTILASASLLSGFPYLCTGRNLAYRKAVYTEVGGFEAIKHSVSGDDDLFLQLVHRATRWKIRYMTTPESAVRTIAPGSFRQFVQQRTRHISASRYYPRPIQLGYAAAHLFHFTLTVGAFIAPFTALIFFCLKLNIDALLLVRGMSLFRIHFSFGSFLINEVLLMLYSYFIGPLGYLKEFRWKESHP